MPKREDYISWDAYFMGVALLSAKRSKDPRTQVGACIVNRQNRIMSVGYNGLPTGCGDDDFPWEAQGEDNDTKYPYVCHAELNAILNAGGRSLENCILYTALYPCCECAKAIIQCGVKEVRYLSDKYHEQLRFTASRRLFAAAGVQTTPLSFDRTQIVIDFS
jgi:dCMP deaminase